MYHEETDSSFGEVKNHRDYDDETKNQDGPELDDGTENHHATEKIKRIQEKEEQQEKESKDFRREFMFGNFEIFTNTKRVKSPVDFLEKLSTLKENTRLKNEEKSKVIQKILKEYME